VTLLCNCVDKPVLQDYKTEAQSPDWSNPTANKYLTVDSFLHTAPYRVLVAPLESSNLQLSKPVLKFKNGSGTGLLGLPGSNKEGQAIL